MPAFEKSMIIRYSNAVLAVVVATLFRFWIDPLMPGVGIALFFVAVVIVAWHGRLGPAVLAIILSILSMVFFSTHPETPDPLEKVLFGLSVFIFVGLAAAFLSESVHAAQRRERARADEAIAQRERLRTTLACMGEAVIVTDRDGSLTMMNPVAESLTGYSAKDATGRALDEVFRISAERSGMPEASPVQRLASDSSVSSRHDRLILTSRDGSKRSVEYSAARIKDEGGTISGSVLIFRDVTQQRQAEQDLREADRRKDEFLATLAHELRNPLAPIRNALQVFRRVDSHSPEGMQAREIMERQLGQMIRLVDDLLDVSRITRGRLELRRERIELSEVVASAVETARPFLDAAGHEFTVTLPKEPIFLDADPTRLAQVFTNLLSNSAKYTQSGGQVWLTVETQGSDALIKVRDNGIGIPQEMLPHVFEMFTQIDRSLERSQGGLGIGLTIVKRLVAMHGGSVEVSSPGALQGTEFQVRLPVCISAQARDAIPSIDELTPATIQSRILVVDDNQDSAETLATLLRLLGNDVRTAYDGQEAVEKAQEFLPELVLLDIGMPKLNGYEAARRLRQEPWGQDIILAALTGWGQDDDKRQAQEAGFDHHFTKPISVLELRNLLSKLASSVGRDSPSATPL